MRTSSKLFCKNCLWNDKVKNNSSNNHSSQIWINSHLSLAVSQGKESQAHTSESTLAKHNLQGPSFEPGLWKTSRSPQGWGSFIWILSLWSDLMVPWSQHHWICKLRQHRLNQGSKTQHRHQERVDISDPFPAPTAAPVAADKSVNQRLFYCRGRKAVC